jgi:hypothetical protein
MLVVLIPLIISLSIVAFWAWMLNDMLHNDDIPSTEPVGFRWPPVAKNHWIVFFIIFSLFTAGYYYFTIYREQR